MDESLGKMALIQMNGFGHSFALMYDRVPYILFPPYGGPSE